MTSQTAGSRFWSVAFRVQYRAIRLLDRFIRLAVRIAPGVLPRTVDLRVAGRRSGRVRATLVTELTVGDARYVGHPNGAAAWTRNLEAAGAAELVPVRGAARRVRAIRLPPGSERDGVVRATWHEQPFPANLIYRLARAHIRSVGVFFRIADEVEPARAASA